MSIFVFDFVNSDGNFDYRIVNGDDYQIARDLFDSQVPDYEEILHVFVRLW